MEGLRPNHSIGVAMPFWGAEEGSDSGTSREDDGLGSSSSDDDQEEAQAPGYTKMPSLVVFLWPSLVSAMIRCLSIWMEKSELK